MALAGCSTGTGPSRTTRTAGTTSAASPTTASPTTPTSASATESSGTSASETPSAETATTGAGTTEPTATIEAPDGPVALGDDGRTMVRLDLVASGGTVAEVSWDPIQQPDGSGVGVLDYDEYAKVRVSTPGEYVVQATATFEDGSLARDTTTFVVTAETTTDTETGE